MPDTGPQLRVMIVDDERLARRRIREMLRDEVDVAIVAECATGPETVKAAAELQPDLIFLDVQMPGLDGLSVSATFRGERAPLVIFVTA